MVLTPKPPPDRYMLKPNRDRTKVFDFEAVEDGYFDLSQVGPIKLTLSIPGTFTVKEQRHMLKHRCVDISYDTTQRRQGSIIKVSP